MSNPALSDPNTPIEDLEHNKFLEDQEGDVNVRVSLGVGALGTLLQGVLWDYVKVTYPTVVKEIYTFKTGGSPGTTTAVIEVTYTNSTKEFIDNVFRSA